MKMERLGKHIKLARLCLALRHLSSSVDNSLDTKRKWLLRCDLHDQRNVHRAAVLWHFTSVKVCGVASKVRRYNANGCT